MGLLPGCCCPIPRHAEPPIHANPSIVVGFFNSAHDDTPTHDLCATLTPPPLPPPPSPPASVVVVPPQPTHALRPRLI